MFNRLKQVEPPPIEEIRRRARVLVIDDQTFPAMKNFQRDGYNFERWPKVRSMNPLTDGHYHLILLDIQGVGTAESPNLQGLGILKSIKEANPSQAVIVYSSAQQSLSSNEYLAKADAVFDKSSSYLEYKEVVDQLLVRQSTPGYFIAAMNRSLGESAVLVPRAVPLATRALKSGRTNSLLRHLNQNLRDEETIAIIGNIIRVGIKIAESL